MKATIKGSLNSGPRKSGNRAIADLVKEVEQRKKALQNLKVPLAKGAVFLDRWVQTNIRTEGGHVGGWTPFALGGRLAEDGGIDATAKLLRDTGRLAASFLPFHDDDDAGVQTDLDYAIDHHEGNGVPIRRLLPAKVEVRDDLRKIMRGHVATALSKNKGLKA